MVRRVQRGVALRRNFHVLRSITRCKAKSRRAVIFDAINYIGELKGKVEAMKPEYDWFKDQVEPTTEVKVEGVEQGFLVQVMSSQKGRESLVKVLGAFEGVGLTVLHATVSCNQSFFMEAIGEAQSSQNLDASGLKQAVLAALQ